MSAEVRVVRKGEEMKKGTLEINGRGNHPNLRNRVEQKIKPLNRAVIISSFTHSNHGHPSKRRLPKGLEIFVPL